MTYLSPGGAYVRKNKSINAFTSISAGSAGSTIELRVLELLQTPQTVESLGRAIGQDVQADREHIEHAIERLLVADVIELSPDS